MGAVLERPLDDLGEEAKTYQDHKAELVAKNEGKYVLIKGDEIIGIFDTHEEALTRGYQDFLGEPFFAHKITEVEMPLYFYNIQVETD